MSQRLMSKEDFNQRLSQQKMRAGLATGPYAKKTRYNGHVIAYIAMPNRGRSGKQSTVLITVDGKKVAFDDVYDAVTH